MQTFTIWEFRSPSSSEVTIAARVSEPREPEHEYQKVLAKIDASNKAEALELYKRTVRTVSEFTSHFRGVPANMVAKAVTRLTPGINWMGCGKSRIAERWANSADARDRDERRLASISLADIDDQLIALGLERPRDTK